MADENIPENENGEEKTLAEDEALLDQIVVTEKDSAQFDPELILDDPPAFDPEKRQSFYQKIIRMPVPQKIRLALLGNREARNTLILDRNRVIALAVLRSPRLSENEVLSYVQQRTLNPEIYKLIAVSKRWTKYYPVKLALVNNPKTPLYLALKFMDHFMDKDLKALARNKNISSVVNNAARQVLLKRGRTA